MAPASSTLPEGQVDSLLSIISSQRERFRTRNQELEAVSHMRPSPTLLAPEDTVGDTQACHRPKIAEGFDLLCAVKEGFPGEAVPRWALKEESDAQGRGDYMSGGTGTIHQKGVQVSPGLP